VLEQVPATDGDELRADRLLQAVRHQIEREQQREHQVDRRGDDQRAEGQPDRPHRERGEPRVRAARAVPQPHEAEQLIDRQQHEDHEPGDRGGQRREPLQHEGLRHPRDADEVLERLGVRLAEVEFVFLLVLGERLLPRLVGLPHPLPDRARLGPGRESEDGHGHRHGRGERFGHLHGTIFAKTR
jgi:hypothetical protein